MAGNTTSRGKKTGKTRPRKRLSEEEKRAKAEKARAWREKKEHDADEIMYSMVRESLEKALDAYERYLKNPQADGAPKWVSPFMGEGRFKLPYNIATNRDYTNSNVFTLLLEMRLRGTSKSAFCGRKQAIEKGWGVKEEERANGIPIWIAKPFYVYRSADEDAAGGKASAAKDATEGKKERKRKVLVGMRYDIKFVYHVDQFVNPPDLPEEATLPEPPRLDEAEAFIRDYCDRTGVRIVEDGDFGVSVKAYYRPSDDTIHVPPAGKFKSMESRYATILHEIMHSTGHADRNSREGVTGKHRKGSPEYAFEELVAETASVIALARFGLTPDEDHMLNHGVYLAGWLMALDGDKTYFKKAFQEASKAVNFALPRNEAEQAIDHQADASKSHTDRKTAQAGPDAAPTRSTDSVSGDPDDGGARTLPDSATPTPRISSPAQSSFDF